MQKFTIATVMICIGMFVSNSFGQESARTTKIRQIPGVATATQSADLSANIPSQLLQLLVAEGDRVQAGQLLATLDYRKAKAAYDAARSAAQDDSAYNLAAIDFQEMQVRLQRIETALVSGASNEAELELARNQYQRAVTKLEFEKNRSDQAKHNMQVLRWELEDYLIRAPFDGLVTQIKSAVGNQVQPGESVLELVHYAELSVELNLPLQLFGKLKAGQTYQLFAESPVSRNVEAKLTFVSPIVSSASQTFLSKFEISNRDFQLPSGFTVRLADDELKTITDSMPETSEIIAQ